MRIVSALGTRPQVHTLSDDSLYASASRLHSRSGVRDWRSMTAPWRGCPIPPMDVLHGGDHAAAEPNESNGPMCRSAHITLSWRISQAFLRTGAEIPRGFPGGPCSNGAVT